MNKKTFVPPVLKEEASLAEVTLQSSVDCSVVQCS
jgi:hypothetical protein